MSRELHSSAVAAIDEFYQIVSVQQLHEISLEQLEIASLSPEQRRVQTGLLSTCYLYKVKPCLENKDAEHREVLRQAASLNDEKEVRNG